MAPFVTDMSEAESVHTEQGPASGVRTQRHLSPMDSLGAWGYTFKMHREPLLAANSVLMKRQGVHSLSKLFVDHLSHIPGIVFALGIHE